MEGESSQYGVGNIDLPLAAKIITSSDVKVNTHNGVKPDSRKPNDKESTINGRLEYKEVSDGFIVTIEDKTIGRIDTRTQGDKMAIDNVFVDSRYRKQGIADKLTKEVVNSAKRKGIQNISALAAPEYLSVLKKNGFDTDGFFANLHIDPRDLNDKPEVLNTSQKPRIENGKSHKQTQNQLQEIRNIIRETAANLEKGSEELDSPDTEKSKSSTRKSHPPLQRSKLQPDRSPQYAVLPLKTDARPIREKSTKPNPEMVVIPVPESETVSDDTRSDHDPYAHIREMIADAAEIARRYSAAGVRRIGRGVVRESRFIYDVLRIDMSLRRGATLSEGDEQFLHQLSWQRKAAIVATGMGASGLYRLFTIPLRAAAFTVGATGYVVDKRLTARRERMRNEPETVTPEADIKESEDQRADRLYKELGYGGKRGPLSPNLEALQQEYDEKMRRIAEESANQEQRAAENRRRLKNTMTPGEQFLNHPDNMSDDEVEAALKRYGDRRGEEQEFKRQQLIDTLGGKYGVGQGLFFGGTDLSEKTIQELEALIADKSADKQREIENEMRRVREQIEEATREHENSGAGSSRIEPTPTAKDNSVAPKIETSIDGVDVAGGYIADEGDDAGREEPETSAGTTHPAGTRPMRDLSRLPRLSIRKGPDYIPPSVRKARERLGDHPTPTRADGLDNRRRRLEKDPIEIEAIKRRLIERSEPDTSTAKPNSQAMAQPLK